MEVLMNNKMHYLYKITNTINQKNYIGQSINVEKRWRGHKYQAINNPKQLISKAIKKYGADNFEFEVIATCKSYDDANYLKEELIKQYNSLARNGFGYNLSFGSGPAPKSEECKESMRQWHASMTPEEKEDYRQKYSIATIEQIETQGRYAQGTKKDV
jgi:group I intron endonuclease